MSQKNTNMHSSGAIFIMPRSSNAWRGAEALWITVAGWSAAAKRMFGSAWVVTSDKIVDPETAIHFPGPAPSPISSKAKGTWVPMTMKTGMKDILLWTQTRKFRRRGVGGAWNNTSIQFVWEQHDLFPGPGKRLADQLGVPFVIYVHAPVVWEAARWGVKRPVWGKLLEHFSEKRSLSQADIVACVSQEVADKLIEMGISEEKVLVSPMAVDPNLFAGLKPDMSIISPDLNGKLIIGWTGSFRSFHGLDLLLHAFAKVYSTHRECVLVLVGDGIERAKIEALAKHLKLERSVIFAGKVSFTEMPKYISLFDIAVVSARSAADFHYSPLKLREYLAVGIPTIAPRAGEMANTFRDEEHLLFCEAGDINDTALKMSRLINDKSLSSKLSQEGKKYALMHCTWDNEVKKLLERLSITELRGK